jgi:HEPN domain-containing protein
MNLVVSEWIQKAEGDYRTASRELRAPDEPNFDAACYHAQQCAEKLMKAVLIAIGVTPPHTHNLIVLDGLLREAQPT